mmetsp:Transcript_19027/g.44724  ORF Transcript_19027/g.44724 Transcript_19027/m.44724 type:complete len:744 (+) Transcript_19027:119-2350(+)
MQNLVKLFSWDTDEVFAYSTHKLVWIRDRHVGYLYYSLAGSVCLFIIGYQILWSNQHFIRKDVDGLPRIWFSHPTRHNCDPTLAACKSDFRALVDLPYCDVYKGPQNYSQRAPCRLQSKISLIPDGPTDNKLFVPTAVEVVTERRACFRSTANNYNCSDEYHPLPGLDCLTPDGYMCKTRGNLTNQFYYVADVRNVMIRFTSSYERDNIRGTSLMHPAYVGICRSQLSRERRARRWPERTQEYGGRWCAEGDFELRPLPCLPGLNCTQMRSVDPRNWSNNTIGLPESGNGDHGGKASVPATAHQRSRVRRTEASARTPSFQGDVLIQRSSATHQGSVVVSEDPPTQLPPRGEPAAAQAAAGMALAAAQSLRRAMEWFHTEAAQQPATEKGVLFSDPWGDVFSLGELLNLAGVDLDNDFNMDEWTTRQAGTALEVRAVYNNLYPVWSSFGYQPVRYHYEVKELMLPYFSKIKLSPVQPSDYPTTRWYEVQHGVIIRFKVGGEFGFFNLVFFGLMLCTALATTAFAGKVTDCVGLYLHPKRDNFFHLKYEVSPDFSDMWRCPRCGFYNELDSIHCKGMPAWMGPDETPECRTLRPQVVAGFRRSRSRAMMRVAQMKERTEARRLLLGQEDICELDEDEDDGPFKSLSEDAKRDLVEQGSTPRSVASEETSSSLARRTNAPRKPTLCRSPQARHQKRRITFDDDDQGETEEPAEVARVERHVNFDLNEDSDDSAKEQHAEARGSNQ